MATNEATPTIELQPVSDEAGKLLVEMLRLTLALTCAHCGASSLAIDNDKVQEVKRRINAELQLAYKRGREAL